MLHPTNKIQKFLRERLAKKDLKVKNYAEKDENLVTTTFNSELEVFIENENNKTVSKDVHSKKDVDKTESVAVKRTWEEMKNFNRFSTNNVAPPFHKIFGKKIKKYLQESPTADKDKPISKITNTQQTQVENEGRWAKVTTIFTIDKNGYFQRVVQIAHNPVIVSY